MKTSKKTMLVFMTCLTLSFALHAQIEIDYNSSLSDPHLLLNELSGGASFSRLTFQNTQKGFWTIAPRTGAGTNDDDFNIFYDNGTTGVNIINVDGDNNVTNFTSAIEVIDEDVKISGADPDLILSSDATGDPAILFGDNGGSGDSRIWFDSSEDMLKLSGNTSVGHINITSGITNTGKIGINEKNNLTSQMTIKANAGNTQVPAHLELRENNNGDGGTIHFTNSNAGYWEVEGDPNGTLSGLMDFNYNNNISTVSIAGMDGVNQRVGIRDDSPEYTFSVDHRSGSPNNNTGFGLNIENTSTADSWTFYTRTNSGGDLQMYYDSNTQDAIGPILRGTFNSTNGAYTNNSDIRLKKNISSLENQLNKIMKLRPTKYQFNDIDMVDQKYSFGLIAQEVQKIIPEVVSHISDKEENGTDYLGISYSELIPVLIGAIQDQQEIINQKGQDIDIIKAEVASLKALILKK